MDFVDAVKGGRSSTVPVPLHGYTPAGGMGVGCMGLGPHPRASPSIRRLSEIYDQQGSG